MVVYHYPRCGTCRKALRWIKDRGMTPQEIDLVETPPSANKLKDLVRRSGLPITKFFNTSGESYRNGQFKEKLKTMTEAQALAALTADGKLIKRPIVDAGKTVLVGFNEDLYARALAK